MLDFIRKEAVWRAIDQGLLKEMSAKVGYQLKTAEDLAIYSRLREAQRLIIGEIGGGDSRILERLATRNECYNIEKFEGADGGPASEVEISGVANIHAFVGEHDDKLTAEFFDVLFSISVVEHVLTPNLGQFHADQLRILRAGGFFLHAVDIYIEDQPTEYFLERLHADRAWFDDPLVEPLGAIYDGPLRFGCDMATNPDNVMNSWNKAVPSLAELRCRAQCVSLLIGGRKRRRA